MESNDSTTQKTNQIMKIMGGKLKGRNFYLPKETRTTQNIVRKAVFDILGQDWEDLSFLDLFAGSGAMGFEAASHNAKSVTLVERNENSIKTIEENIYILNINSNTNTVVECIYSNAFSAIKKFQAQGRRFDIIYLDPPYGENLAKKALKTLEAYDILQPTSVIVVQHDKHETLPAQVGRFLNFRESKYGATVLSFYNISGQ